MKRETPRQFIMKKNRTRFLFAFAAMMLLLAAIAIPPRRVASQALCVTPPSDMVSWWPGDGTAQDIQNGNHGILENGATFDSGKVAQAFSFRNPNNPDDRVNFGNHSSLNVFGGDYTFDMWINADSTVKQDIFMNRNVNDQYFGIFLGAGGFIQYHEKQSDFAVNTVQATTSLTAGQWHHVAVVRSAVPNTGLANYSIYIDGIFNTSITGVPVNPWSGQNVILGAENATGQDPFSGLIDEVEVFNRALTPAEILAIYTAGSAGKCKTVCTSPPSNMISWWDGDGDANDIQDSNHGTLQNGATFAPGKVGEAFSFDRIDDFVHVPDSPNLSFGDGVRDRPFSIDAWVFPETLVVGQAGHNGNWIINKRDNSNNEEWQLGVHDSGRVFLTLLDDSPGNYIGCNAVTGTISTNTWQHIAATYDGSSSEFGIKLYVNGALIPCTPVRNGVYVAMNDGTSPVRIGMNGWNTLYGWDGLLDEIEIFNRVLTQSEIAAIYNAGSAGKCKPGCVPPPPNMTSWWDAEGNANDIQGPHDGTLHGNTGFSPGKVGQAFSFDGGGDYVDVGDVDLGAQFTMDAWIKPDSFANAPMIISKPTHAYRWFIRSNSVPSMFLVVINADNGGTQYESIPSHVVGQWQHVAVTYNGIAAPGNRIRFYLNGQPLATGTVHNDDGGTPINDAAAATLGRSLSLGQDFDGLIDELEIFDRALTDAEIAAIYNAGSAGKCKDIDECPDDPNKTEPGICGCGIPDTDSDNDGTADCNDSCPADPNKINPGLCGCGVADTDSDNDGTPDCNDACPADPNKSAPGACGCGVADTDSDNDGTADCTDQCPNDPNKINPGACGCGFADTDSDGDGAADCLDQCPNDPGKTAPGECGCGVADTDTDHDGIADCRDNCPLVFNPDQRDTNGDGVGDVCTPFQFPEGGQFVIGDGVSLANGATVYFWGSHWAQNNPMSGGPGPNAFKGFENGTGTPTCGGTWTSQPGNSSNPPPTIPQYMAVLVSSSITKNGSVITGNIQRIIVVKTNPGYGPNPGHAGTGQVVAIVCEAPTQSASLLNLFLNSRDSLESWPGFQWLSDAGVGIGTFRRSGQ